jgi:hypothetical protein
VHEATLISLYESGHQSLQASMHACMHAAWRGQRRQLRGHLRTRCGTGVLQRTYGVLPDHAAVLLSRWKAEYRLVPDEQDQIEAVLRDLVSELQLQRVVSSYRNSMLMQHFLREFALMLRLDVCVHVRHCPWWPADMNLQRCGPLLMCEQWSPGIVCIAGGHSGLQHDNHHRGHWPGAARRHSRGHRSGAVHGAAYLQSCIWLFMASTVVSWSRVSNRKAARSQHAFWKNWHRCVAA